MRELDQRSNSGLTVRLDWDPVTNVVSLAVQDRERSFAYEVEPSEAREAFEHPYVFEPAGS